VPAREYVKPRLTCPGNGDPSQDVAVASVIFLIDGKLVLLQPSTTEAGNLKYDMRFIGHDVEYYVFARNYTNFDARNDTIALGATDVHTEVNQNLCDSLWVFDGVEIKVWTDIHDLLLPASVDSSRELPEPVSIAVDFYPLSPLLDKGILFGIEAELVQRRDGFALFRAVDRVSSSPRWMENHDMHAKRFTDSIIPPRYTSLPPYQL